MLRPYFFLLIHSLKKQGYSTSRSFIDYGSVVRQRYIRYGTISSDIRNQCRRYLPVNFQCWPHFKFDGRGTTQMAHMRHLAILVLLYATLVYSQQLSIFVAVDGSDVTGDGSMNKPFQTIGAAQNFIKINVTKANYNGTF
jgi:hypothetical protein